MISLAFELSINWSDFGSLAFVFSFGTVSGSAMDFLARRLGYLLGLVQFITYLFDGHSAVLPTCLILGHVPGLQG